MIHGFHEDMQIISALSDTPGLPSNELKAKFDAGGVALKSYINESLIPDIEDALDDAADTFSGAISGIGPEIEAAADAVRADIPAVVNSLTSTSTVSALSAKQGKTLKDSLDSHTTRLTSVESSITSLTTTVNQKQKTITCGTAAPSGGANGDIYLKY